MPSIVLSGAPEWAWEKRPRKQTTPDEGHKRMVARGAVWEGRKALRTKTGTFQGLQAREGQASAPRGASRERGCRR